jgi:phosphopantetheinyl transferase (holo-ACP synthase)
MTVTLPGRSSGDTGRAPATPKVADLRRAHFRFDDATDIGELVRVYLGEPEAGAFEAMSGRARTPWLLGRVAAKNAVRDHLASRDFAEVDPTRIIVRNDTNGRPSVEVRGARFATRGVQVSIAHKPAVGVAVAARVRPVVTPAGEAPVASGIGIDIEAVEPRPPSFAETILSSPERTLLDATPGDLDTWLTRVWAVKEAAAKATGLGLRGRPKDFAVEAVDDDRLRCCGRWITTEQFDNGCGRYIVAWTDPF